MLQHLSFAGSQRQTITHWNLNIHISESFKGVWWIPSLPLLEKSALERKILLFSAKHHNSNVPTTCDRIWISQWFLGSDICCIDVDLFMIFGFITLQRRNPLWEWDNKQIQLFFEKGRTFYSVSTLFSTVLLSFLGDWICNRPNGVSEPCILKTCSIGLRFGQYGGKKYIRTWYFFFRASTSILCARQLSKMRTECGLGKGFIFFKLRFSIISLKSSLFTPLSIKEPPNRPFILIAPQNVTRSPVEQEVPSGVCQWGARPLTLLPLARHNRTHQEIQSDRWIDENNWFLE